ncbi:MAG: rod shape-determining protein RodA [Myxococcaceae bacterium]
MLPHVPWGLIGATFAISVLGIWNLASASRPPHNPVWVSQTIFLGIATVAAVAVALVDYRFLQRIAVPVYVVNILALIALKKLGHTAKGAESWIALGPIRIQPAEFMKIGVILMLAKFYNDDYRPTDDRYGFLRLWKPVLLAFGPAVLVLVQPDLGTFMMIALSSVTVLLFGRVKWHVIAVGAGAMLLVAGVIWHDYVREPPADGSPRKTIARQFLKHHQDARISGWLEPEADQRGSNYHSVQSKIAVGSGGLTGKGWKQGTQTGLFFLPEQHTDFIFSVLAEEHGFVMCLFLLVLYAIVLLASLGVAYNARDRFGAFAAVGVAAMLFWQIFENIGMVIGLLPVTGITLPLMSYGGSSLVSVMIGMGLLINIGMRRHIF